MTTANILVKIKSQNVPQCCTLTDYNISVIKQHVVLGTQTLDADIDFRQKNLTKTTLMVKGQMSAKSTILVGFTVSSVTHILTKLHRFLLSSLSVTVWTQETAPKTITCFASFLGTYVTIYYAIIMINVLTVHSYSQLLNNCHRLLTLAGITHSSQ